MLSTASVQESVDLPRTMTMDASMSEFPSPEVTSDPTPSSPEGSHSSGSPDRHDPSTSSPSPSRGGENQSAVVSRSEEYRQLFRLPAEEVLVQDFNCACQESILLQGHMYLFIHYICFYSNIFGYETKKIIPFEEISCVKRAKTAGIFPNAIEILAGGKKYFFASFLSRDEAFKLIHDGWLEYGIVKVEAEIQDSLSESNNQVTDGVVKRALSSMDMTNELDNSLRDEKPHLSGSSSLPVICQNGVSPSSVTVQRLAEPVVDIVTSSTNTLNWKLEELNAPKLSSDFTKVAEAKFLIPVEEFFRLFFSDGAVSFVESFHKNCGDKEFRCTSWQPHEKHGHTRNVSFQHPIKIYFGAKFGSCQESQKFQMYRDSHLVIETSQEITDVPYGDYFTVEGVWDVKRDCRDSIEGSILDVYVNVAFSKRTVWKGKIVHSTVEECREAYGRWIKMAHQLLKQKLEKQEGNKLSEECAVVSASEERVSECEEERESGKDVKMEGGVVNILREAMVILTSFVKRQSWIRLALVIAFAVILLMQVTIVVLLKKGPEQREVGKEYNRYEYSGVEESIGWVEKRMHFLREEVIMVEDRLKRMQHDHGALKAQLHQLERH